MKSLLRFLCLFAAAVVIATPLRSQSNNQDSIPGICGYEFKESFAEKLIKDTALFKAYQSEHTGAFNPVVFPMRITVFRHDDGTPAGSYNASPITQEMVTAQLAVLNEHFAEGGISFVQDGPINYIDNTKVALRDVASDYFSFTTSAQPSSFGNSNSYRLRGIAGAFRFPWPYDYSRFRAGSCYVLDSENMVDFRTWEHEMGHVFHLVHTFQGAKLFNAPRYPLINDPGIYDDEPSIPRVHRNRELVIRDYHEGANYPEPNSHFAGDFITDTPAWCGGRYTTAPLRSGAVYPSSSDEDCHSYPSITTSSCSYGCGIVTANCSYVGDYVDYNGHPIDPETVEISIRNFMSYHNLDGDCRNSFTAGQFARMSMIAQEATRVWDIAYQHNLTDYVEFRGTDIPVKNVNIMMKHPANSPANGRHSRMTTPNDGVFHGILYDQTVKAKITMLGSGEENNDYDSYDDYSYRIYHYTREDWTGGVTTADLVSTVRHILNQQQLDGYGQIAADVDNSGNITVFDVLEIRSIILGMSDEFSGGESGPWKFVPEYISNTHSEEFNENPFNMTIGNTTYNNEAPYLRSDWYYKVQDGFGGLAGYDAVKLGDVNGSAITTANLTCSTSEVAMLSLGEPKEAEEYMVLNISAVGFENITGLQLGFTFDDSELQLLEVNSQLPGFKTVKSFTTTSEVSDDLADYKRTNGSDELRISWNDPNGNPNTIRDGEPFLQLYLKTKQPIADLNDVFFLDESIMKAEFNDDNGCSIPMQLEKSEVYSRKQPIEESYKSAGFYTFSEKSSDEWQANPVLSKPIENLLCFPNPVEDQLIVAFRSIEASSEAQLILTDVNGRLIQQDIVPLEEGINRIEIPATKLPSGVLLVSLVCKGEKFSRRVIKR